MNSWNLKEASHECVVFTASTLGIRRKPRAKASLSPTMDAILIVGFARNIVFFWVNGASVAEIGLLAPRLRASPLPSIPVRFPCAVELMVPGDFLLFFDDAVLLCFFSCVETLCALELLHPSDVFYSSALRFYCVFATRCLQIAVEWPRQGSSQLQLQM